MASQRHGAEGHTPTWSLTLSNCHLTDEVTHDTFLQVVPLGNPTNDEFNLMFKLKPAEVPMTEPMTELKTLNEIRDRQY